MNMVRCLGLILTCSILIATAATAQAPVRVQINTAVREFAIPDNFVGLGFEIRNVVPNTYGVNGYFFGPRNTQLITLFRNAGVKEIRVGGGTVDGSGGKEKCAMPTPTERDVDNLFQFAQKAGIKVIYSVRLLNLRACANPQLAQDDAKLVRYIWHKYRANVESFSIGNEPDWRSYHSRPGHVADPAIVETVPGVPGSAYASYFADWLHFANVIRKAAPAAVLTVGTSIVTLFCSAE